MWDLVDGDAFLHEGKQAIRGDFEAAGDGDAAGSGEELGEVEIKGLFKADVAPPRDDEVAFEKEFSHGAEQFLGVFLTVNADEVCQRAQLASLEKIESLLVLEVVQVQMVQILVFIHH